MISTSSQGRMWGISATATFTWRCVVFLIVGALPRVIRHRDAKKRREISDSFARRRTLLEHRVRRTLGDELLRDRRGTA